MGCLEEDRESKADEPVPVCRRVSGGETGSAFRPFDAVL